MRRTNDFLCLRRRGQTCRRCFIWINRLLVCHRSGLKIYCSLVTSKMLKWCFEFSSKNCLCPLLRYPYSFLLKILKFTYTSNKCHNKLILHKEFTEICDRIHVRKSTMLLLFMFKNRLSKKIKESEKSKVDAISTGL